MVTMQNKLLLLMLIWSNILYLSCWGNDLICENNQIKCGNNETCINNPYICDGDEDCGDGSDEASWLCEEWYRTNRCSRGQYKTGYGLCIAFQSHCDDNMEYIAESTKIWKTCKIIVSRQIPLVKPEVISKQLPPLKTEVKRSVLTSTFVNLLSSAVNSTLDNENCPMLYTHIGNHCIAFFSLAQVPWPEARQFCQSVYGDLISFDDVHIYRNVHEYLKEKQLTTDYWLGGRYNMDNNSWTWLDDSPMPQGSPYWAERYSSSCVPRALPPNDPFGGPGEVMPGAPCYNYIQAPKELTAGYCAAITYEHFYYVTDEECTSHRSPLCVLNSDKLS